jgi:type IV pilus assembly protein PilQ
MISFIVRSRLTTFIALLVGALSYTAFAQTESPQTTENSSSAGTQTASGQPAASQTSSGQTSTTTSAQTASAQTTGAQAAAPAASATAGTTTGTDAKTDAAKTPPVLPARGTYNVSGDGARMTVFAVSSDAQEVLTAIAARANLKLVVDDSVSRKLTVNIVDKSSRQIIDDIASAYGLSVADVDGVTMVSEGIPRSASSYLLSDIDAIPTKYVDAANARNLLPVFLQDYVKVNAEQNAVVLSAPRDVLRKFRQDIAQFDIPASQILVDLLLVELTDSTVEQLGLRLAYSNSGVGIVLEPGSGSSSLQAITKLDDRFFFGLRALQEQGKARVRANPRVATVSGRRATIFVGRQRYVATPIEGGRNFIDAGVRLNITPYTGGEKQVLVDVDAEVSTLSALDPITRLPEKSTRTANTTVRVNDGQTIVIGGLRQQESRDIRTKVPILGNIPLLGALFRGKDSRTTQSELVLFITPRLLSDTGHLPEDEERALTERFLNSGLGDTFTSSIDINNLSSAGTELRNNGQSGSATSTIPPFQLKPPAVGPTPDGSAR